MEEERRRNDLAALSIEGIAICLKKLLKVVNQNLIVEQIIELNVRFRAEEKKANLMKNFHIC
jgi:hypothetical protein